MLVGGGQERARRCRLFSCQEAAETGPGEVLVLITHKTSERPAAVKMVREDGAWKFGLVETFWGRRE